MYRKKTEDGNYDVVVAVHDFGKGVIAYFGDVNAEDQTIALVAAFVESRSPKSPIESNIDSALPQTSCAAIWPNSFLL